MQVIYFYINSKEKCPKNSVKRFYGKEKIKSNINTQLIFFFLNNCYFTTFVDELNT